MIVATPGWLVRGAFEDEFVVEFVERDELDAEWGRAQVSPPRKILVLAGLASALRTVRTGQLCRGNRQIGTQAHVGIDSSRNICVHLFDL